MKDVRLRHLRESLVDNPLKTKDNRFVYTEIGRDMIPAYAFITPVDPKINLTA